ncbi:hypothetical protein GCM10010528_20460 [Gordonia defluvii]|uniref:Extracellular solute-binding protein n=1 Tax=Gordonia defluvii TaxID=283718 RepID=A0ABP6LCW0_9ACTN|nr:hypothetical protein [Gordonia sp. UBA5067]
MARNSSRHGFGGGGHPLLATVLVVLLVAGLGVAWFQARDRVGRQADQAAGTCVAGPATVPIITSPDLAEVLGEIAKKYNATRPVVRDHCVTVQVRPGDSKVTLDGLLGTWESESMGARPAAWIPQSSVWAAELTTARPRAVEGDPDSLVTSPVVLAMRAAFAEKAAGKLGWGRLPELAKRPDAMAEFGLPTWGPLRLAMPLGPASDATALAGQAIAADIIRATGPLTVAEAKSPPVTGGIGAVLAAAPPAAEGTAAATVVAISKGDPRRGIHAVPITEQQLFLLARTRKIDDDLRGFSPSGPTPVADYPVLRMSGNNITAAQSDGVAQFIEFAKQPTQIALLTALGYRSDRAPLPTGGVIVGFAPIRDRMQRPEPAASVALSQQVLR